jgi:hypothetical protein
LFTFASFELNDGRSGDQALFDHEDGSGGRGDDIAPSGVILRCSDFSHALIWSDD